MVGTLLIAATLAAAMPCEALKQLKLPDTAITSAELVPAGFVFTPPPGTPPSTVGLPDGPLANYPIERLPVRVAYCEVVAVIRPTPDSEIGMELWLPAADKWNGKLIVSGNGGWGGAPAVRWRAVNQGYAAASTDTGHTGGSGAFALGHPEKVIDFAYRAVHETTVKSKQIIASAFDTRPRLSYFDGCSTGGRQALMAAQRYPEDFDGIIAGAPANNMTGMAAWRFAFEVNVRKNLVCPVSQAKLTLVNRAVLAACDGDDGVVDDILADPRRCAFDPTVLLCEAVDSARCLTACEVEAMKMAYAPARKQSGETIFPGLVPGAESRWLMFSSEGAEPGDPNDLGLFRYVVHQDANWDWRTFDLERDSTLAEQRAGFLNATNPDLSAFKARGGKLILYHGWNDGGNGGSISPLNTVDYYNRVLERMGPQQSDWLRLYMVPGMSHCQGGPAPDNFDLLGALERWREKGQAPGRITAARVNANRVVDMTRPICPYPEIATYTGSGSTVDAENFVCRAP